MCEFHFDYIKSKYVINSRLLLTNIVSMMYEIKTEDVYEDFSKDKKLFDFSNCPTKLKLYDDLNKLVVGKIKMKQLVLLLKNLLN